VIDLTHTLTPEFPQIALPPEFAVSLCALVFSGACSR